MTASTESSGGGAARLQRPPVEQRLLTLEEVATYLAVSVQQAYSLVRHNTLPGVKIGGRGVWRVDRRELEAYVERLQAETNEWVKEHPLNPRDPG